MLETSLRLLFGTAHPQKVCRGCALGSPPGKPPESRMARQAVEEVTAAVGVLPRPPPKRMAKQPLPTPMAQALPWHPSLHHAAADRGLLTTTSPIRRTPAKGLKRWAMQAQPGRAPGTRLARMGVTAKQAPH